ncbi:MAG: phosphodiester glycosidase family protein [Goleter apudmare HA4340-LM2]|jgi:hypothetical protein|nr:phosphodiester glycosidase family protein [Goleter apudmare HA4340-LM2]
MQRRKKSDHRRFWIIAGINLLLSPLVLYALLCLSRPPRTNQEQILFNGVVYQRRALSTPRLVMMHIVTVDLTAAGVKPLVTPGIPNQEQGTTKARTTTEFLREFQLQLAINASYFYPFRENNPWDYYPHSGDIAYPLGDAIANGSRYAKPQQSRGVVCFSPKNVAKILASGQCPQDTVQGVAGKEILVTDGKPVISQLPDDQPYSRVVVAVNKEGTKLWLIIVDGKQPFYSDGLTIPELSKTVADLGVYTALKMDGGGSTTLAVTTSDGVKVLNAPIHTHVPMRERPVANHLGFFALNRESGRRGRRDEGG